MSKKLKIQFWKAEKKSRYANIGARGFAERKR